MEQTKTDVVLFGATGFTGARVLRYLCEHTQLYVPAKYIHGGRLAARELQDA